MKESIRKNRAQIKKERKHKKTNDEELNEIYKSLNEKIDEMPFIKIV